MRVKKNKKLTEIIFNENVCNKNIIIFFFNWMRVQQMFMCTKEGEINISFHIVKRSGEKQYRYETIIVLSSFSNHQNAARAFQLWS